MVVDFTLLALEFVEIIMCPNSDSEKDVGYSNAFHNDGMTISALRFFVCMKDGVTRDTGAFRFHDKIASKRLVRRFGFYSRWRQSESIKTTLIDNVTLRHFEGNAGDSCIVITQECIHAASIPSKASHRDILQFEIHPSFKPISDIHLSFCDMSVDQQIN